MYWNQGGHMAFMWLWWVLILAAVPAAFWFGTKVRRGGRGLDESPEQRLKMRYAAGEIDGATFHRMLLELRN